MEKLQRFFRFVLSGKTGLTSFSFYSPNNKYLAIAWEEGSIGDFWRIVVTGCTHQVYGNQDVRENLPFNVLSGKDLQVRR